MSKEPKSSELSTAPQEDTQEAQHTLLDIPIPAQGTQPPEVRQSLFAQEDEEEAELLNQFLRGSAKSETPTKEKVPAPSPGVQKTSLGVGKSRLVVKSRSRQAPPLRSLETRNEIPARKAGTTNNLPQESPSAREEFEKPETPRFVYNDPLVGEVINGRFRLLEMIGKGGMGKVYKAQQVGLTRLLVIKLLHPHFAEDPVRKARFHREAEAMTRFSHPNAVTVYDFGEWNQQMFMAMELLRGGSLAELMKKTPLVPQPLIVSLLGQVCLALEAAHNVGLIHRDLKPENIMLEQAKNGEWMVKLVDFGLAYFLDSEGQERLTAAGVALGTPCYMSPEQARGKPLDVRTDIYALGIMLYEMLCGSLPFLSRNITELMMQHIFEQPATPTSRAPDISINPALEELALSAMSKRAEHRPQTALAFRELLLMAELDPGAVERVRSSIGAVTREERATKLGMTLHSSSDSNEDFLPHAIAVVEELGEAMDSTAVRLVTQGFFAEPTRTLQDAASWLLETSPVSCRVIVVRLGSNPAESLEEIILFGKQNPALPIAVVGPSTDAALMTRALEEDIDYLPDSQEERKLPRHLKRLFKKHFRKKNRNS